MKLVTLFDAVCVVTDEPVWIQRNYVKSITKDIVIIRNVKTGARHWVLRDVIEEMPETIRRDSFNYKPGDRDAQA
jgi:hypothetical protein